MQSTTPANQRQLLGIDTGGTFTDFVLLNGGSVTIHKVLSTPSAPEQAILQGLQELGLGPEQFASLSIVHGSTVATNAVLEGKGVRTVYITNRGFGDLLSIGRQARGELYNLQPPSLAPPVPSELCLETGGRVGAQGEVIEPLEDSDTEALKAALQELAPEAVAINLLFSYLDDRAERAIEEVVPEGIFTSRSSAVLAEYREYERGIATWLNAWVGPLMAGYLGRLQRRVSGATVSVMQSSGSTIAAERAAQGAVHMLLSGPAGGLAGARFVASQAGRRRLLSFDMGGTSTDVALINGELQLTSEGHIGRWPVSVPMVDMHTIGAGGGSIASVDSGGLLQVGPQSAGADPGPACYGRGGSMATVTDANLLLGRLRADAFLGGAMALDVAAARRAVEGIAGPLGLTLEEAAVGIVRVADEHMARALRVMSVQRGVDPGELTLVSFGGAGGLHVCALADALGIDEALVPIHAGVLSALGMLAAPRGRELSHTVQGLLDELGGEVIESGLSTLHREGREALLAEGVAADQIALKPSLDLRYRGQSYTLSIGWEGSVDSAANRFHQRHQERYGHRMALPLELVNLRLGLSGPALQWELQHQASDHPVGGGTTRLYGIAEAVPVRARESLRVAEQMVGPSLITETVSTTYIAPGWRCQVDGSGSLLLQRLPQ